MKKLIRMTDFLFRPIPNYENYMISECGKCISKKSYIDRSGHIRKQKTITISINRDGRRVCIFTKDGNQINLLVSRLVAMSFIPNPDNKPEVNHIDGNKLNDHRDNLEWSTGKENKKHAVINGLTAKGERNGKAVLKLLVVESIKKDLESGLYKDVEVARRNNTSHHNVSDIKNKRTWKD